MSSTADRFVAALADRYRVDRELGQGGMATVYLAEDVRHRRRVGRDMPEFDRILAKAARRVAEFNA